MSSAILAVAALVIICRSDLVATNISICTQSTPITERERMQAVNQTSSSGLIAIQRKMGSIKIPSCFGNTRGHKRTQSETVTLKEKPRYVHTPQHAAESFARTTSPIPFRMRPLSEDITIQPVKTTAQLAEERQEQAREKAGQRGRVHAVGAISK